MDKKMSRLCCADVAHGVAIVYLGHAFALSVLLHLSASQEKRCLVKLIYVQV